MSKNITPAAPGTYAIKEETSFPKRKTTITRSAVIGFQHLDEKPFVKPVTQWGPIEPWKLEGGKYHSVHLQHPDGTVETYYGKTFESYVDYLASVQDNMDSCVVDKTLPVRFPPDFIEHAYDVNGQKLARRGETF